MFRTTPQIFGGLHIVINTKAIVEAGIAAADDAEGAARAVVDGALDFGADVLFGKDTCTEFFDHTPCRIAMSAILSAC